MRTAVARLGFDGEATMKIGDFRPPGVAVFTIRSVGFIASPSVPNRRSGQGGSRSQSGLSQVTGVTVRDGSALLRG